MTADAVEWNRLIRDVPDFPKPGITFKDITPLLADAVGFRAATDALASAWRDQGITHVAGVESRGFILAAPVAQVLGAGLIPIRKPGKLPAKTLREDYALEYGTDALEIHMDAVASTSTVLVLDDVLATGGTAVAACRLIERAGATVAGCQFLVELRVLAGRARLGNRRIESLIGY